MRSGGSVDGTGTGKPTLKTMVDHYKHKFAGYCPLQREVGVVFNEEKLFMDKPKF